MLKLLDLCCGAGGCSVGYKRAAEKLGLDLVIVGVDNRKQKRYPFTFIKADALEYFREHYREFTHVHASPPCQLYSRGAAPARIRGTEYSDLLLDLRVEMYKSKLPGVIENVICSPLIRDIELTGQMFGLKVLRKRVFETVNWFCLKPSVPLHRKGAYLRGEIMSVFGHSTLKTNGGGVIQVEGNTCLQKRRNAMGIDWMSNAEIVQAIPPAYTEFIGMSFLKTTSI